MRKLAVVVVMLLLVSVAGAQAQTKAERTLELDQISRPASPGIGFGQRIAGTWLGTGSFDLDFDCDGVVDLPIAVPVLDVHTFDVGGSYMVTNPNNPNSVPGTWEQTGPRQLTGKSIGFGSDSNCVDTTEPPDGICDSFGPLVSIFSIKTVVDFDPGYLTATTSFAATVHPPTEDPLDPDALVNLCTVGAHTAFRKVTVEE